MNGEKVASAAEAVKPAARPRLTWGEALALVEAEDPIVDTIIGLVQQKARLKDLRTPPIERCPFCDREKAAMALTIESLRKALRKVSADLGAELFQYEHGVESALSALDDGQIGLAISYLEAIKTDAADLCRKEA